MSEPVLLVVDDDRRSLDAVEATLRRRYAQDYMIITESSPVTALSRLRELQAADQAVASVMNPGAPCS